MALFDKPKSKEKIEQHRQAELKKGEKFIGRVSMHRNHILWELNNSTLELKRADIELRVTISDGQSIEQKKVVQREGYSYFPALNRKNAIKKLKQVGIVIK